MISHLFTDYLGKVESEKLQVEQNKIHLNKVFKYYSEPCFIIIDRSEKVINLISRASIPEFRDFLAKGLKNYKNGKAPYQAEIDSIPDFIKKEPTYFTINGKIIADSLSKNYLVLEFEILDNWILYSMEANEKGPTPMDIKFIDLGNLKPIGEPIESQPIVEYDVLFDMDLSIHKKSFKILQEIDLVPKGEIDLEAELFFMLKKDFLLMPPEQKLFKISVNSKSQ